MYLVQFPVYFLPYSVGLVLLAAEPLERERADLPDLPLELPEKRLPLMADLQLLVEPAPQSP